MKIASILTAVAAGQLLFVAAMYASSLAREFHNSDLLSASIFSGKSKFDMDQIRFELGGCIYAAFCISFLGNELLKYYLIIC